MKMIKTITLFFVFLLISSCTTIPPESVDLSSEVGVGLKKQHQAQIELIDLHFAVRRKALDDAMERALDKYFEALTPTGTITLNKDQLNDVAKDVMELSAKNNAAKEELDKARVLLY